MKTNYLKIAFMLGVIICIAGFSAASKALPKSSGKGKTHSARKHAPALSDTKIKNVEFGFNKCDVPASSYATLDKVAKQMADKNASLNVSGYADNRGGYVYNWKLSEKRAKAVKSYLVSKGADSSKIAATEFGFTHPVASNKTVGGRQRNRRVEVHFVD